MNIECLRAVCYLVLFDDVLVLTSIGNNSGYWGQLEDREANLFHLTMGMCSSAAPDAACAGMTRNRPRQGEEV